MPRLELYIFKRIFKGLNAFLGYVEVVIDVEVVINYFTVIEWIVVCQQAIKVNIC